MRLRYVSVCSGIEAATVAWHPLGWTPAAFAQFDPAHKYRPGVADFPSHVLAHHYGSNLPGEALSRNAPPNLGDLNGFTAWPDLGPIDLLVGGTPCQSFSVAGLRAGLADPRGNLALAFLGTAHRFRPRWLVWENVPGVLSSGGGRDFAAIIGGMVKLGYGIAWRVLDAQYVRVDGYDRAVPQRRERVFVVGHLGDPWRAAAVLFDGAGLRGDPPPRRKAGQGAACGALGGTSPRGGWRIGADEVAAGQLIPQAFGGGNTSGSISVSAALAALAAHGHRIDFEVETFVAEPVSPNLTGNPYGDHESREGLLVAHARRAEGFDASEDGTGRGIPIVPEVAPTMRAGGNQTGGDRPFGMDVDTCDSLIVEPVADTLTSFWHESGGASAGNNPGVVNPILHGGPANWAVRRLMPIECERLQGFPDGYTAVPWRGKPAADGPRYKALGNSMAVNVMRWLGRRIEMVEAIG